MKRRYLETIIEPPQKRDVIDWRDLWTYRELVYFLCWRDIKVRYKQTILGVAWAVIQPVFTMVVFSIFFGKLAQVPSDNVPYPIFSYTGLIPWTLFSHGLLQASNSLVNSTNLITKVYFPRVVIPVSSVLSGLVDFFIAFIFLIGMMIFYGFNLTSTIIWLPVFIILTLTTTIGVGLWLSALNVKYRDIRYVVPFLTQFWLFITPIAYPSSLLSEPWRTLYGLNPMTGVVEGFRWVLLGNSISFPMLALSFTGALFIFLSGVYYFQRMEQTFADIV